MILSVASQKGGVGKTTTAYSLAAGLHARGYSTLLIDLDPQCNLTYTAGADPQGAACSVYDIMQGKAAAAKAVYAAPEGDIIPGSYALTGADREFVKRGSEYTLKRALEALRARYQYIVIDCPPTLGILTINALTASNAVLIPLTANVMCLQGLAQLNNAIQNVRQYSNSALTINGLLLTRYRQAIISRDTKDAIESVGAQIGARLYNTVIREGIAVTQAQDARQSLFTAAPKAKVTADYNAFIDEFLKVRE